jgi:cell division protein FtsQ
MRTKSNAPAFGRSQQLRSHRPKKVTKFQFSQPQQHLERARQSAAVPLTRTVTSRGAMGLPAYRPVQTGARKRHYISLSTPGAEVRLPSLPDIRFGWRFLSGILALFLLAGMIVLWKAPTFQLQQARLLGAKRISAEELNLALDIEGLPAVEASPAQLEQDLRLAFPDLQKVHISISLPAAMTVRVVERTPVLAWEQDGKTTWIDKEGFNFPVRGDAGPLPLVKAQGNPPAPKAVVLGSNPDSSSSSVTSTTQAKTRAALAAADGLPQPFISPDLIDGITLLGKQAPEGIPVVYDPQYGLGWDDPQGWKVYFGSQSVDMVVKLNEYKAISKYLNDNGIKPVMVSVEFPQAPFYRLEQ